MADLLEVTPNGELNVNFHSGQAKAWNSKRRTVAVVAGTQSGKTSFAPLWLWREIQLCGPGDYGFVTPNFTLLEVKALPEFIRLFQTILGLGTYTSSPIRRFVFSRSGALRTFGYVPDVPTQVFFGYAENPDSLESATYKAVVCDEAGQKAFKRESREALQRRLAIHSGRDLVCTTPYGTTGWLKDLIDKYEAGDETIDLIQFASTMNPNFPVAEFERARANLPSWKFDLFYRGILTRPAGMIYDSFHDGLLVPRFKIPVHWKRWMGLDFGGVNTAAILLAEEPGTGRLFAYREYHAGGLTAAEHARALLNGEVKIPDCVGGSKSEGQWRNEFRAGGLPVREPDQPEVEIGIDRVYGAFKQDRLRIFDDLVDLRKEINGYTRKIGPDGEPTAEIEEKSNFHRLDALRYIMSWLNRKGMKTKTAKVDFYKRSSGLIVPTGPYRTQEEIEAILDAE